MDLAKFTVVYYQDQIDKCERLTDYVKVIYKLEKVTKKNPLLDDLVELFDQLVEAFEDQYDVEYLTAVSIITETVDRVIEEDYHLWAL